MDDDRTMCATLMVPLGLPASEDLGGEATLRRLRKIDPAVPARL
jgi:hypothetical protein